MRLGLHRSVVGQTVCLRALRSDTPMPSASDDSGQSPPAQAAGGTFAQAAPAEEVACPGASETKPGLPLDPDVSVYFRDQLRAARARAHADAEDFHSLVVAIERLGQYLHGGSGKGLGSYGKDLKKLARRSPTISDPRSDRLAALFDQVRRSRNDAVHTGAMARHFATSATDFALILEAALNKDLHEVHQYMVRNPVCAHPWQTLELIRAEMLMHGYSCLPVYWDAQWQLLSDTALAQYLRTGNEPERSKRMHYTLEEALSTNVLKLDGRVGIVTRKKKISAVLSMISANMKIVLVKGSKRYELAGILTVFDLL